MTKNAYAFSFRSFLVYAFLLISTIAFSQKQVPELWNMRVHDEAHVLTGTTIDQLESRLKNYEDSTSNQIAILIMNSLDGEAIEEYSIRVAEKWQLGQKSKDNGVLLLIAIDDRKMRIEVGEGLEGVLTDAVSNRIIRNEMAPAFRRGDYDEGVTAAIDAIINAIGGEYTADDGDSDVELTTKERILIGIGLYLFLSLFAFFALVMKGCTGWGLYAFLIPFFTLFPAAILMNENNWYVPGLIYILGFPPLKIFVSKTAWGKRVSEKMGRGSSSGGGGWGGWSSGGGGWSSGGGGFSGGGGSFGGGGSSGSW